MKKIESLKRYLKRNLKGKIRITTMLVCIFLVSNTLVAGNTDGIEELKKEVENLKKFIENKGSYLNVGEGNTDNLTSDKKLNIVIAGLNNKNSQQNATILGKSNVNEAQFGTVVGQNVKLLKGNFEGKNFIRLTAIGTDITIKEMQRATAIGNQIKLEKSNNLNVIGWNNNIINSAGSTILGNEINLENSSATIAIGSNVNKKNKLSANGSVLIGKDIVAEGNLKGAVLIGTDEGMYYGDSSYVPAKGKGNAITAVGSGAQALANKANAFGFRSIAAGESSISIGVGSKTTENSYESVAIGTEVKNDSPNSVVIGRKAEVASDSKGAIAIGTDHSDYIGTNGGTYKKNKANGKASTAIGAHSEALNEAATALGTRTTASGKESLALGANAIASFDSSVALGSGSKTAKSNGEGYLVSKSKNYNENLVVSVGGRRIQNLEAGSDDLDAVNVKQLKALPITLKGNVGATKKSLLTKGIDFSSSILDIEAKNDDGNVNFALSKNGIEEIKKISKSALDEDIKKGFKVKADDKEQKKELGGTVEVISSKEEKDGYSGKNLKTYLTETGAIALLFKDAPEFKSIVTQDVAIKNGDKQAKLTLNDDGKLAVEKNGKPEEILTKESAGDELKIKYKVNNEDKKEKTLNEGLQFEASKNVELSYGDNDSVKIGVKQTDEITNDGDKLATEKAVRDYVNGIDKGNKKEIEDLKNGKTGPLVYTDDNGKKADKNKATKLSLVNPNGDTKTPVILDNVANTVKDPLELTKDNIPDGNRAVNKNDLGKLAKLGLTFSGNTGETKRKLGETLKIEGEGSVETVASEGKVLIKLKGDIVTKDKLNKVLDNLGVDNEGNLQNINALKDENGKDKSPKPTKVKDAINNVIDTVNKGFKIKADSGQTTKYLGSTVSIKSGDKNLSTKVNDSGEVLISISDTPTFSSVKLGDNVLKVDKDGDLATNQGKVITEGNIDKYGPIDYTTKGVAKLKNPNSDSPIVLSNIADGKNPNDAVNVKQLNEVKDEVKSTVGGVSNAVAMANLVQVTGNSTHRHLLSAAYGYYNKSHSLAIGFSGISKNNNFIYKLSGAVNNQGNLALGIGAGIMLGEKNDYKERKDTILLKKEFEDYKTETDKKIRELEGVIKKLLNK